MTKRYLGIDPGLKGALVWLNADGAIAEVEDMPVVAGRVNASQLSYLILGYGPVVVAAVEQVHSMPKQGVTSAFTFGYGCGQINGVLAALGVPVVYVPPTVWKKRWHLGSDKERSRRTAIERWPSSADQFALKKHADRAEAALLAAFVWEDRRVAPDQPSKRSLTLVSED
jgi:crossover junction endodeoxyribonuclease RuvC